ncbi:hypothetical protein AB0F18_10320 [Streptomyces sp. NPDC029216]|uniref:hypothetical protein n=1 Tax=Streptomyces sp. NPDC029216 TaxID=3154701 RepID=UPI0034043D82
MVACGRRLEVRDSAALLDAVAWPEPGDPHPAPETPGPFADQVRHEPGRLRIAFSRRPADGHPVHADCLAPLDDALWLLAGLGRDPRPRRARTTHPGVLGTRPVRRRAQRAPFVAFPAVVADITGGPAMSVPL